MSRDIKFELVAKNMSGATLREVYTLDELMSNSRGWSCWVEIIAKRQYTGLKDKNGVEIFEGDIISYWDGSMIGCKKDDKDAEYYPKTPPRYFKRTENKIVEVVYKAPSFSVRGGNPLWSMHLESNDIEVIGDIHQHPELLEGKQ